MTTTDPTPLAEQIAREHRAIVVWADRCSCSCGASIPFPDDAQSTNFRAAHTAHIATVTERAVREQIAAEIEVAGTVHRGEFVFSAVGDAYANAARIARGAAGA